MVHFIELLVIMLTFPVAAPIGIGPLKTLPVNRMSSVPRQPHRRIPALRSDHIGGRIGVIWSPAILRAEKVI
jgi:hypothetical protein